MKKIEIQVPALGESITEATVAKWFIKKGEHIKKDAVLLELETDKVNLEVPSPVNGVLSNIKTKEGETVNVGSLLGTISKNINQSNNKSKELRFIDAISEAIDFSMSKHNNLIIMGQDIAEYGGVFKITEGFVEQFGKDRVRNTPICESAIVETGMGLSIAGMKAVVEMQFSDFVTSGFNPIISPRS